MLIKGRGQTNKHVNKIINWSGSMASQTSAFP